MRDSDWSREILLRSDWLGPSVAPITTALISITVILMKLKWKTFQLDPSAKKLSLCA